MEQESLDCPNCGASVSSDKTACEFCGTPLKTVACPSCFGLMFLGSKFCSRCGAKAVSPTVTEEENRNCPRCKIHLGLVKVGETTLHECEKCGGLWTDVETFENICADNEKQSAVLGHVGQKPADAEARSMIRYVACPDCGQLMNRNNFAHSSGVIIDVCKPHGIWFDADELPKIIEFIRHGGMEHARQKELAEISDERSRLRNDLRNQSAQDQQFSVGKLLDSDENAGIRGFIRTLFD